MMLPSVVSVQFPCVGQCHAINPWWALELLAVVLPTMVRGHGQFLYAFDLNGREYGMYMCLSIFLQTSPNHHQESKTLTDKRD